MDRIDELRQLALNIADEIGLDSAELLQNEVELLSKRLGCVRESIDVLADIAEARSNNDVACNRNIADIKNNLMGMQEVGAHAKAEKQIFLLFSLSFLLNKQKNCLFLFS